MSFNTIIDWNGCSADQQQQLLTRPAISASDSISKTVTEILNNVKANGDAALREYSAKFDKTTVAALQVSEAEIAAAGERLSDELKQAMAVAVKNIETFHNAQQLQAVDVETLPGVRCQQVTRPIASVGLYIPGGSAPLFSTVLMLATPARIAGCQQVVLCSPPPSVWTPTKTPLRCASQPLRSKHEHRRFSPRQRPRADAVSICSPSGR